MATPAGTSTAPGDVFYAEVGGAAVNPNYLWYDEQDLGLDPGTWVNGVSTSFDRLSDNLDALDSDSTDAQVTTTAVHGGPPAGLRFAGAPNPFTSSLHLQYTVTRAAFVRLVVYDLAGRAIATLANGLETPGLHGRTWDGSDGSGHEAGPGIYFARLEVGGDRATRKLVKLR